MPVCLLTLLLYTASFASPLSFGVCPGFLHDHQDPYFWAKGALPAVPVPSSYLSIPATRMMLYCTVPRRRSIIIICDTFCLRPWFPPVWLHPCSSLVLQSPDLLPIIITIEGSLDQVGPFSVLFSPLPRVLYPYPQSPYFHRSPRRYIRTDINHL